MKYRAKFVYFVNIALRSIDLYMTKVMCNGFYLLSCITTFVECLWYDNWRISVWIKISLSSAYSNLPSNLYKHSFFCLFTGFYPVMDQFHLQYEFEWKKSIHKFFATVSKYFLYEKVFNLLFQLFHKNILLRFLTKFLCDVRWWWSFLTLNFMSSMNRSYTRHNGFIHNALF